MNQSLAPQESPLSNDSWDNVLALLQRNGHTLGPILLDGSGRYKLVKLDGTLRRLPQVLWIALPYMAPPMPASDRSLSNEA